MRTRLPLSRKRQRGAILIMTAAFIVAAVALLALAVDTGRLYAAQQKLQSAANLAALDAARQISECRPDLNQEDGRTAADESVKNNYANVPEAQRPTIVRYEEGHLVTDTGLRQIEPVTNTRTKSDAVRLTVENGDFSPLFSMFEDDTTLHASAGATAHARAQISIGTNLVGINPDLLSELLPIDIGAAQKGDLANVFVSVADLLNLDAGVATHQQLLETSLNGALENLSSTVSNQASGLIDSLAGLFPTDANAASILSILDIAGDVGTDLKVNAGQIVNAAAQLAASQRDSAISRTLTVNVPGINSSIGADIRLLESGKVVEGPAGRRPDNGYRTEAKSAQVAVALKVQLLDIDIEILSLSLLKLPLIVQAAPGTVHLESINCPTPDRGNYRVEVSTNTSALRATAGEFDDTDNDGDQEVQPTQIGLIDDLSLLFLPLPANALVGVRADVQVLRDGGNHTFEIQNLEADLPTSPVPVGSALDTRMLLQRLLSDVDLDVDIIGINLLPIGRILDPVNDLLSGPLATALAPVLDPLLTSLGLSLGNADVQLLSIDAGTPQLICTSANDCGFDAAPPAG